MELIFYIFAFIGSISFGYSLLRIGFPEKQEVSVKEKVMYSYGLGILVLIPSIMMIQNLSIYGFFIIGCIFYFVLAIFLFAFRTLTNKQDKSELYETKQAIPATVKNKINEEKKKSNRSYTNNTKKQEIKKPQIFKEENTKKINKEPSKKEKEKTLSKLKKAVINLNENNEDDDEKELEDLVFK